MKKTKNLFTFFLAWQFVLLVNWGYAQERIITGVVVDAVKEEPIPGVNIILEGTTTGTTSDDTGKFSIKALKGGYLTFKFIGMKPQKLRVTNYEPLLIKLETEDITLDEVVAVGYGSVKRSDLTGSVATVKSEDINQTKTVSFAEALQGRVAGVQISSQSGEPGSSVSISIRGANSINAGTQPLYVIDGVQIVSRGDEVANFSIANSTYQNPMASLNPADIESIEVLKDASATAIYGARGANGVIIVTTKKGKQGKPTVEFSSYISISEVSKKLDVLDAVDYAKYRFARDAYDSRFGADTNGDGILDTYQDYSDSTLVSWQDELFRNALTQNYNLSFSGANNKTSYAVNVGVLDQQGVIINNDWNRYNANIKIDQKLNEKMEVGANMNASHTINTGVVTGGGVGLYQGAIQNLLLFRPFETKTYYADDETSNISNPRDILEDAEKVSYATNLVTSIWGKYELLKNLTINLRTGGRLTGSKIKEWYPNNVSMGRNTNGYTNIADIRSTNYFGESTVNYTRKFANQLSLTSMLGMEFEKYENEKFSVQNYNFEVATNGYDDIGKALGVGGYGSSKYSNSRVSYFGRLNLSYKDRYLFTSTMRADGSSKFGEGNKFSYFPSAALAWRVSEEDFMKALSSVSNLKLRVSVGSTGNDRISEYASLSKMSNAYYSSGGTALTGLRPSESANADLKWETTYQYSSGIDLGLFNSRVQLTADYYYKQTKDMLLLAELPSQTGYTNQWQNIGQVDNQGVEVSLNTINVKRDNFSWETNFTFNLNRNKVISLGEKEYLSVNYPGGWFESPGRIIKGEPIGTGYGLVFTGIYQIEDFTWQNNSDPSIDHSKRTYELKDEVVKVAGVALKPGDLKYQDLNGPDGVPDGIVDDEYDRTIISRSEPKHNGGLNNVIRYKNFDLNFFLQWSYGNEIVYEGKLRVEAGHSPNFNVVKEYWDNHWTPENPTNKYQALGADIKRVSTFFVEDGSYLRLQTLSLGYTLSKKLLRNSGISNCRLYLSGQNLFLLTNYPGFDPEVNGANSLLRGFDRISYPRTRSYILGVNIKF